MVDLTSATAARQTAVLGGNTLDNKTWASEYCPTSDSEATFSPKTYPGPTKSKPLEVLPWLCIKGNFLDHIMLPWLKAQSQIQIPSTMWLWSSRKMGMTTPNGMPNAMLHIFYVVN